MIDLRSDNCDIWLEDIERAVRTRFTFDPAVDTSPVWSPDGRRSVFASNRKKVLDLYVKDSSGAGNEELLFASDAAKTPSDWSRDGRYVAFTLAGTKTNHDIWVLPLVGDRKAFPFVETEFEERNAVFSPDGHWLAYQSDASGSYEVYVAPFPGPGGKWKGDQAIFRRGRDFGEGQAQNAAPLQRSEAHYWVKEARM